MTSRYSSFADRIIEDIIRAIKLDPSLTSFEIIPTASNENKNSSPVLRGGETLGLESWALKHVLPHANRQILDPMVKKDPDRLIPYLWAVNLLNPDMPTAWGRRKELLLRRRLSYNEELQLTRMTLSRKPKCNEALAHRRWLVTQNMIPSDNLSILRAELELVNLIADRYHSNYHAWTHRIWVMQNLAPVTASTLSQPSVLLSEFTKRDMCKLFTSSPLQLYLLELETNQEFIATHVSDHSGLHYRKFLLNQIFLLLRNNQDSSYSHEESSVIDGETGKEALLLYNGIKQRLRKMFDCQKVSEQILADYFNNVELRLTIFDVLISILVFEINTNSSLNRLYVDHEALWTFRRFLIHHFQLICNEFKLSFSSKSDPDVSDELNLCDSGVANILLSWLYRNEEVVIKSFSDCSSAVAFSRWLHKVLR